MLEIVEGEAIGWSRCARAKRQPNSCCYAPSASQHGFGAREKPLCVEGLCRVLDRGTKGALTLICVLKMLA